MTDQWVDADGVVRLRGTFTGGAMRMLGPFTLTGTDFIGPDGFDFMAALIYTPTDGDAIIGFSWILREVFDGTVTDPFTIAPQTTADSGTAGPTLTPGDLAVTLKTVQGQGVDNTGGDYGASVFLPVLQFTVGRQPDDPSTAGPVISDGTALYISGAATSFDPVGALDVYVYVATPVAP